MTTAQAQHTFMTPMVRPLTPQDAQRAQARALEAQRIRQAQASIRHARIEDMSWPTLSLPAGRVTAIGPLEVVI